MKLSHKDALNILGIKLDDIDLENMEVTRSLIKTSYRQACSKYHPDRNPAGLEMMKLVNAAAESLGDVINGKGSFDNSVGHEGEQTDLGDEMNAALNAIIHLGLTIEICGAWIWVSGDTREHKELLKSAGYRWAPKKLMWHWRPADSKSWSRGKYSMDEIRGKHGSFSVKGKSYNKLAYAS